jgi:hypothetical protein
MAAGQGFKTFTTGEVLTAGDVNGYLMQGINVFTNATARDAAITAPAEGQFAFTKDNNSLWYYDGAAWVASGATGDIEGVTAGVGISGGGTSGTVTVTNSMATAIDAKGDLVPGTGADTFARLAVGANDTVLTADSSTATGLKWAAPTSGMTLIRRSTFASVAGTGTTFDGVFSTTYETYLVVIERIYSDGSSSDDLQMQLRYAGPTTETAGYVGNLLSAAYNATSLTFTSINGSVFTLGTDIGAGNYPSSGSIYFTRIGDADYRSSWWGNGSQGTGNNGVTIFAGVQDNVRTYTGFLLKSSSGTITGEVAVYGLAK